MSDPTRRPRATQSVAADGDLQWRSATRVYRSSHRNDWLILLFFAALPLATSADIAYELGWSSQSGRLAMLAGAVIATTWATAYYAMKIAVHVSVSASGLAVHQGPWHGEITWREMARLSERARGAGAADRLIVAEAMDGRRLTIPSSSLGQYERFVSDINATFTDWRTHAEQPLRDDTRLDLPLAAAERPHHVVWLLALGLGIGVVSATLLAISHGGSWLGAALAVAGVALATFAVRRRLATRTMFVDDQNISVRSRLTTSTLAWSGVTGVEQHRDQVNDIAGRVGHLIGRALHRALSLDRWTGGDPWPHPAAIELVIRGAGRRLRVRLDRIEAPEELQAHLLMRLRRAAEIKATTPPVRRVTQRLATMPRPSAPADGQGSFLSPTDAGSPG
jgi:hypothetical protein